MQSTEPTPDTPSSRLQVGHLLALVVAGGLVVYSSWSPLDSTIGRHLAYGKWIVDNEEVPSEDPFSPFTGHGSDFQFVDPSWLSQVVFHHYQAAGETLAGGDWVGDVEGGVEMLRLLHVGLTLLLVVLLLGAYWRRCDSVPLACLGLVLLAFVRPPLPGPLGPEVLALVCYAIVLFAVSRKVLSLPSLVLLPCVFVLWTNLHGSYVIGLFLIGVVLLSRVVEVCRERKTWLPLLSLTDPQVCRLLFVLPLAVAATVVNPEGTELFRKMGEYMKDVAVIDLPGWQPLKLGDLEWRHIVYMASLLLLTLTQAVSPRLCSPTTMLVTLSFAILPLLKQRFLVWWFPLVPWLLMPQWAAIVEKWKGREWLSRPVPHGRLVVVALGLLFVVIATPIGWLWRGQPRPLSATLSDDVPWRVALQLREEDPDPDWFPALGERLRKSYPDGRYTGLVYTTETTGDFLMWALPDEWPVFMYSQVQFFRARHWKVYTAIRAGLPEWWELLDRQGVNLIVIERSEAPDLAAIIDTDPAWEILPSRGSGKVLAAVRKNPIIDR